MDDHYETLEVRPDAPPEVIAAVYRGLRKTYAPDGTRPNPRRLEAIEQAHAVLCDPDARRAYDAELQRRQAHQDQDVEDEHVEAEYVEDEPASTPTGRSGREPIAPMDRRIKASLIDLSLITGVGLAWYALVAVLGGLRSTFLAGAGWYGTFGVIHVALQGRTGLTPGKHRLGLRAVRVDGGPPGIHWVLLPYAYIMLPVSPPWGALFAAGLAVVATGPREVGVIASRTYVVPVEHAGGSLTLGPHPGILWLRRQAGRPLPRRARRTVAPLLARRSTRMPTIAVGVLLALVAIGVGSTLMTRAWSAVTGEEADPGHRRPLVDATWQAHTDEVTVLAFSPDSRILATAGADGTVRLWDVARYSRLATLDQRGEVTSMAFTDRGAVLVTAGDDESRSWDTRTYEEIASGEPETSPSDDDPAQAVSPDGTLLAQPGDGNTVQLWDVPADEPQDRLRGHGREVLAIEFSPDGTLLASADAGGRLVLWDTRP